MKKSIVCAISLLSAFAVAASASDAQAAKAKAKKSAAKLECVAYDWHPSDTGLSKGFCLQYQSKRKS